ncbi:anti-CBASS protein Acb1 family protein [Pseudomonas oryzihabitans]|uniref:anti-CBASS protein Acb1 family protein n=1 Tax=Pseudomonas oryzihabitans TaxID=47885 RepID=UPI0028A167A1|nr:anti-CBASS Acb1 family protein [Pseudomonas oryzihabitans]
MSVIQFLNDRLANFVAGLGTERDKAAHSIYAQATMSDEQLLAAYRGAWLPRKIVDIPAHDACRRWRGWQASKDEIQAIEAEEKRLAVVARIRTAMIRGRLFGGAAVFIGTGESDTTTELRPDRIGKGGVKYLTVMNRRQLKANDIERDVMSPLFGRPRSYRLVSSSIDVHPSRLVIFGGAEHADPELAQGDAFGWSDSVLIAIMEAIKQSDGTMANVASLVFESKVDVIKVEDLMEKLRDPGYSAKMLERFQLAQTAKGINGTLILDKQEEYDTKTANFANLPDIMDRFLQVVSGAADIPATRLLSQSPAGLNSTGDADLRNYYDRIQASQELDMRPGMAVLDECLIRSALGSRPPEIHYNWNSLWQPTATERATIGKTIADTLKVIKDTGLFPDAALSQAAENVLVENSVLPGLEAAMEEYGESLPDEEGGEGNEELPPGGTQLQDAAPRPLYVQRKVVNTAELLAWAKGQGFEVTVPADQLHVTIAYSKQAVDWMTVGTAWNDGPDGSMTVPPGGARLVEPLGDEGAVVLLFNSSELAWRHMAIREAGASWDFEDYQPHITITYQPGAVDLAKVEPYRGRIELGPEIFEPLDENWNAKAQEA